MIIISGNVYIFFGKNLEIVIWFLINDKDWERGRREFRNGYGGFLLVSGYDIKD